MTDWLTGTTLQIVTLKNGRDRFFFSKILDFRPQNLLCSRFFVIQPFLLGKKYVLQETQNFQNFWDLVVFSLFWGNFDVGQYSENLEKSKNRKFEKNGASFFVCASFFSNIFKSHQKTGLKPCPQPVAHGICGYVGWSNVVGGIPGAMVGPVLSLLRPWNPPGSPGSGGQNLKIWKFSTKIPKMGSFKNLSPPRALRSGQNGFRSWNYIAQGPIVIVHFFDFFSIFSIFWPFFPNFRFFDFSRFSLYWPTLKSPQNSENATKSQKNWKFGVSCKTYFFPSKNGQITKKCEHKRFWGRKSKIKQKTVPTVL